MTPKEDWINPNKGILTTESMLKGELAIRRIFPEANINKITKFSNGLTSSVYKIDIDNPEKTLVVKIFPKKIEEKIKKSAQISNYVRGSGIPAPHTYDIVCDSDEGVVVMDCLPGTVVSDIWGDVSSDTKDVILARSVSILKKIHDLEIPLFWVHEKHEVTSQKEWIEWTSIRIQKYLIATEINLDKDIVDFLKFKFARLQELYDIHSDFRFVPLHWDYHLSNINIDESGEVCGVFDFDNAMKGHDMADIGQMAYWLVLQQKMFEKEVLEKLCAGYGNLSLVDREFIELHFLLFLAGVMRSTWNKEHLRWLNELHVQVLKSCIQK